MAPAPRTRVGPNAPNPQDYIDEVVDMASSECWPDVETAAVAGFNVNARDKHGCVPEVMSNDPFSFFFDGFLSPNRK